MRVYEIRIDFYNHEFFPKEFKGYAFTKNALYFENISKFWKSYWDIDSERISFIPLPMLIEKESGLRVNKGYFILDIGSYTMDEIEKKFGDNIVDMSGEF